MDSPEESHFAEHKHSTDEDHKNDLSGEAAGVVRGVSRSVVRAPLIGRLPAASPKVVVKPPSSVTRGILRRNLPTRQVARVSDRVSKGWDFYASARDADGETTSSSRNVKDTSRQWLLTRIRSFSSNLLKNTLLGMAVFESYGYVVGSLAPPQTPVLSHVDNIRADESSEDDGLSSVILNGTDEYSRASLPVHFLAGSLAGTIHGIDRKSVV